MSYLLKLQNVMWRINIGGVQTNNYSSMYIRIIINIKNKSKEINLKT